MTVHHRNQRGAVMAEFALSVMLFLILVFGIIEFAFAMFQWSRVVDATREGARAAAVNDRACGTADELAALCSTGTPLVCDGIADDSPIVSAMNRRKLGVTGSQVKVTYSCSTAGSAERLTPIPEVVVELGWQHTFLMAGVTLGTDRQDLWSVTLPSFATTRLGEDMHTPVYPE